MADTVDPVEEVVIGDDHELELVAVDRDGERIDLTDQKVSFALRRFAGQTALVDKNNVDDSDYVVITNAQRGEYKIVFPNADTALLTPGRWIHVTKREELSAPNRKWTVGQSEVWAYRDTDNWSWRDVQGHVLGHLGSGVLVVELTGEQLFECILSAVNEYSRLLPLTLYNVIKAPQRGRVDLTPYGYGRGLLDVRADRPGILSSGFGFNYPISTILSGGGGGLTGFSIGELEETLGYLEMVQRVTGSEFEWEWDPPFLYVSNCSGKVFYAVADNHILQTVPSPDREWINKFALAKAKGILGAIRGKYSQVNTPGGGTSLDGETLRNESSTEVQALLEELRRKLPDQPFIWG